MNIRADINKRIIGLANETISALMINKTQVRRIQEETKSCLGFHACNK